jgi:hypothetical protein
MDKLGQAPWQLVEGHIHRSGNVPEWTVEFIGTTHVKNQGAGVPR